MEPQAASPAAALLLPIYLNLGIACALTALEPKPISGMRLHLARLFHTCAVGLIMMAAIAMVSVPKERPSQETANTTRSEQNHPRNAD